MSVSFWDPLRELEAIRRQFDRLFSNAGDWDRPFSRISFLPGLAARNYPLMNVSEDKDNVYVEALAPGLDPDTLQISVLQDTLRISGEKAALNDNIKPEAFHRRERAAGKFVRTMALPVEVNSDAVSAEYKNGILMITLPKTEKAKPKQIQVTVN